MARANERYAAVQALKAEGKGIRPIQRELGFSRNTVRRLYYASTSEETVTARRALVAKAGTHCNTCGAEFPKPRKPGLCGNCEARARRTREHHDSLAVAQGNLCAICRKTGTEVGLLGDIKKLCVDHCHKSGGVRGLLCGPCNRLLGLAFDEGATLRKAARYVVKHRITHADQNAPVQRYVSRRTLKPLGLTPRGAQVIEWRTAGITFKEIGNRLGVTRQRATQLWEQATTASPQECWCGIKLPAVDTTPGAPPQYCNPEHAPHPTKLLTWGEYGELVATQGGLCAICQKPEPRTNRGLTVDHCHRSGLLRELLCSNCNAMLGMVDDNTDTLEQAAVYLEK